MFSPSAKAAEREEQVNERPIHSVWYGRADMTPDETPPPSNVHDTGIERWIEKAAAVNITPLVLCDSRGKDVDSRRRGLEEIPVTVVQRDEELDGREPADGEEAPGEKRP